MPSDSDTTYEHLQATDTTDAGTAVRNLTQQRAEREARRRKNEHQVRVRQLVNEAKSAFARESEFTPSEVVTALHWHLRQHPRLGDLLSPANSVLDAETRRNVRRHMQLRDDGRAPANVRQEFVTLVELGKTLGYLSAITDPSGYAPVRMGPLNTNPGKEKTPDDMPVFGRRRIGHDSLLTLEDAAVTVSTKSCEHLAAYAKPRMGKDATIAGICGDLQEAADYKWVSLHDDGRMETPMIAIPCDETPVQNSLEAADKTPRAYPTTVYYPAMGDIPDYLPGNFEPFTIGIDDLTPDLLLRFAQIPESDSTLDEKLSQALEAAQMGRGSVSQLIEKLREFADTVETTIEISELKNDPDNPSETIQEGETVEFELPATQVLQQIATQIARLAGEGLLARPGADTNLDIRDILRDQDSVAVLCCNYLSNAQAGLKFTLMDIFARLIFNEKSGEGSSRLPRVAMEVREMKDVAPSKWGDVEHVEQIKPLRQTLFRLSTRGQSRGIMMLGSTQKVTDLYRSIRSNMGIEIVLQLSRSGLKVLDDSHQFTQREREQILGFSPGQGMLFNPESSGPTYPIYFSGARCGLGDKDREWLDRYGIAFGARLREHDRDDWQESGDEAYWINAITGEVNAVKDDGKPPVDERLKWYLLPADIEGLTPADLLVCPHAGIVDEAPTIPSGGDWETLADAGGSVAEIVRRAAMFQRRDYPVPSDLLPEKTPFANRHRTMTMRSAEDALEEAMEDRMNEVDVPEACRDWVEFRDSKVENMTQVLMAVAENEYSRISEIAEEAGIASGTVSGYFSDGGELGECIEDTPNGQPYLITPVGERALGVDWEFVLNG
ncbi:hypothetical protein [Halorubellus sp. PRR65]|uniref:hypothetical protein n=1 Tax=Halorubellus sp. PRR65 TaxID=3098148 RepID=UPI002B25B0BC|nr:hypothetical protein [Halorubellus sp. PRR65]